MSGEDTVDVKIESLFIGDSSSSSSLPHDEELLYSPSVVEHDAATATVSFGGSMSNMQILSPQLCPTTGLPVIESKPSYHPRKIEWSGHRHLSLQQHLFRRKAPVFATDDTNDAAWSGDLPDIVELTVRYRGHTGVGFILLRQQHEEEEEGRQDIPLQSDDWAHATLRVRVGTTAPDTTPSVAACSTSSSSSSSSVLQQLYTTSSTTLQQLWESSGFPAPKAATTTCSAWEQMRQAVVACNPMVTADDLSTIATRESWGDF